MSLTESAGCVLPGSDQCCYRTPELKSLAKLVSGNMAPVGRPALLPLLYYVSFGVADE